jgi:pilus assembly protein Flp/PilA
MLSRQQLEIVNPWRIQMKDKFLMLCVKLQNQLSREEGQDLIEYALVVALIALAATAGMKTLATDINAAFTSIGTTLTTYTG